MLAQSRFDIGFACVEHVKGKSLFGLVRMKA